MVFGRNRGSERDIELEEMEKLPPAEKKRRMDEAKWLLPETGCFFMAQDATEQDDDEESTAKLHVRHYIPQGPITATLFHFHGIHAHVNTLGLEQYLSLYAAQGVAVVAIDLPGHGFSEGSPMFLPDFERVFDVLESFIEMVRGVGERDAEAEANLKIPQAALAQMRTKPYFIHGESMGGLITAYMCMRVYAEDNALRSGFGGGILVCPALVVDLPPPPVTWVLRNIVAPSIPSRTVPAFISSSAALKHTDIFKADLHQEMSALDNRPYPERNWEGTPGSLGWRHGVLWATALSVINATAEMDEKMAEIEFPFLILHAPDDVVCPISGSQKMMEVAASTDKTLVELPGELHGLTFNCPKKLVDESVGWIRKHLAPE